MALTIMGRYTLGAGAPSAPVMEQEGIMFYRDSLQSIRKAIFMVSDGILATIPVASRGTVYDHINAVVVNNNYVICERENGVVKWNMVDLTTGAIVNAIGVAAHDWSGRVFTDGTDVICPGNTALTANLFTSKVTPPIGAEVTTPNTGSTTIASFSGTAKCRAYFNGEKYGLPYPASFFTTDEFITWGVGRRDRKSGFPRISNGTNLTHYMYGPRESNYPVNTVFYNYGSGGNPYRQSSKCDYYEKDGFVYGCCWFSPAGTGGLWRFPAADLYDMTARPEYDDRLVPMAPLGTGLYYELDSLHINQKFGKLYYVQGTNLATLHHAKLGNWPLSVDTLTLDPGNTAIISGIWTFPPFIYLSKTAGATGPQLIKIYDSDLTYQNKARRSGSEIWELIPEVGHFLM